MSHSMNYELTHHCTKNISEGSPDKLGATIRENGVNFALHSQYAEEVYLLLFHTNDGVPTDIIKIENKTDNIWHIFVHDIDAGQLYGYKIRGKYDPNAGMRFNEYKLLLDPYAKALTVKCYNHDNLLLTYDTHSPDKDLTMDTRDNTDRMSKSIVIDDSFAWQNDRKLNNPMKNS